jgi:hypothetical protein
MRMWSRARFRRLAIFSAPLACFVASRLVVFLTLYIEPVLKPGYRRLSFFSDWDAGVYLRIARSGYPQLHSPGGGFDATAAFFPLLPLLTRAVHNITRLPFRASGIAVANAAGLAAFCVIWLLFREFVGERRATVALAFFAFWPSSFVLSMVFSDGLLLLFAGACLLMLQRERWGAVFAFGFLAGLARPDGVVLGLCAAWTAYESYKRHPSWRPWLAALGAPLGFVGYLGYLWVALGSPTAWFTAEHRGWDRGFDFGRAWWSNAVLALHHPTARVDLVAGTIAGVIGVVLVAWMIKIRLPAILTIYAGAIIVLALCTGAGASVPRYCLDAFPIFLAPTIRLRPAASTLAIGCSAGALSLFMLMVTILRTAP